MNFFMQPELEDIIQWDVANWSKALGFWQPSLEKAYTGGRVLTLGERHGGLSLWLANKGIRNICSDYGEPSPQALELHRRYGVSELVEYQRMSAFELPFADNSLDVVVVKSVIGGLKRDYHDKSTRTIENQRLAMEEIRRVLKPGGVVLGAENMMGGWFHRFFRKLTGKDQGWRYLSTDEMEYLLRGFKETELKFYGFLGSSFRPAVINRFTGPADAVLSQLLPGRSLYIAFYAATK
jgi:SAM-dependent methyltransferase